MLRNLRKSVIGSAASALLLAGLISVPVMAAESVEKYDVWVGGVQVTSENKDNVFANDAVNDNKVKYDPTSKTLSFSGAEVSNIQSNSYIVGAEGDLTVTGNAILLTGGTNSGIYSSGKLAFQNADITVENAATGICSEGDLDIKDSKILLNGISQFALSSNIASDISISGKDTTVEIHNSLNAVMACDIEITDGTLNIENTDQGITSFGNIMISDGKMNILKAGAGSTSRSLTVTGDSEINISTWLHGLIADNITFNSGKINIDTTLDVPKDKNVIMTRGMYSNKEMTISGKDTIVNVKSKDIGISANTLNIENAYVRSEAFYLPLGADGKITITGKDTEIISVCNNTGEHGQALNSFKAISISDELTLKLPVGGTIIKRDDQYIVAESDRKTPSKHVVINSHILTLVPGYEPTVDKEGRKDYYKCDDCSRIFEDAYGENEITDMNTLVIPKLVPEPTPTSAPTPTTASATPTSVPAATPTSVPAATPTPAVTSEAKPTSEPSRATATPATTPVADPTASPATPTSAPAADPTTVPSTAPADSKAQIMEFVKRIYIYVLDREPEEDGAAFWSDELWNFRRTGAEVAQGFIFSPEFEARNTTDEQFVTILYKTFFGRDPEAEGIAFWLDQLSTGAMDRVTVANGFIYSQEWADTCAEYGIRSGGDLKPTGAIAPTEQTYAFVERMYTTAMARGYDEEGKQYWASELANFNVTGEQVGAFFFLSDEMASYNLDDKEFVNRLYKTFMDRESDADGEAYWLGVMASGTPRTDIVMGFTRSPEFTEKCVEARILPY